MKLSSILTKVLMAVTGLLWFGFLVAHLSGNFLLLKGQDAFDGYAAFLHSTGGLLYLAEVGLILFFVVHIVSGVKSWLRNRRARPSRYAVSATEGEATLFSRSMVVGGFLIAIFVVTHVYWFKFATPEGMSLFSRVVETFQNPLAVAWYLLALAFLGMHLSHGLSSAFQTLGILKPHWRPHLKKAGVAVGWLVTLGFMSLPVWAFLTAGNV